MKVCYSCKQPKPDAHFSVTWKRWVRRLASSCKECEHKRYKNRRIPWGGKIEDQK